MTSPTGSSPPWPSATAPRRSAISSGFSMVVVCDCGEKSHNRRGVGALGTAGYPASNWLLVTGLWTRFFCAFNISQSHSDADFAPKSYN